MRNFFRFPAFVEMTIANSDNESVAITIKNKIRGLLARQTTSFGEVVNVIKRKLSIFEGYNVLVLVVLILLGGCATRSSELNALEASASIIQLTTGREVSRWHQDKGVALGKPIRAEVRIEYEPANNYTKEDVYNEIVTILEKNNWDRERQNIAQSVYYTLPQDGFSIVAKVRFDSESNIVSIDWVTIITR